MRKGLVLGSFATSRRAAVARAKVCLTPLALVFLQCYSAWTATAAARPIPPSRTVAAIEGGVEPPQSAGTTCPATPTPGQSATLLPNGSWLLLGGLGKEGPQAAAFLEDPELTRVSAIAGSLGVPRAWHTATVLPDGTVLILGGVDSTGRVVNRTEQFDPVTGTFRLQAVAAPTPRAHQTGTVLADGTVLFAGGISEDAAILRRAELWNPTTGQRKALTAEMSVERRDQCATLLASGKVLLWGGTNGDRLR